MILIGQYDSSFVRRIGIALTLYGIVFEHRPWSILGDADKIRPYNPLLRVPTLILDDKEVLVETFAILDHLDSIAPSGKALIPATGAERRAILRIAALASGLADMFVSLFYELRLHESTSPFLVERRRGQIRATLQLLDADRAASGRDFWFTERLSHADIAVACVLRHLGEAHPGLVDLADFPALSAHAARMEAIPVFKTISQPFIAPA